MAQGSSIWQVETDTAPARPAPNTAVVPLKWAYDALTGEPRYIHDPEVVEEGAECQCPACDLSLTPVLAGNLCAGIPRRISATPKAPRKMTAPSWLPGWPRFDT